MPGAMTMHSIVAFGNNFCLELSDTAASSWKKETSNAIIRHLCPGRFPRRL